MTSYVSVPFPPEDAQLAWQLSARLATGDRALRDQIVSLLGNPMPIARSGGYSEQDILSIARATLANSDSGRYALIQRMASKPTVTADELLRAYERGLGEPTLEKNPHHLAGVLASFVRRVFREFKNCGHEDFTSPRAIFDKNQGIYEMKPPFSQAFIDADRLLRSEGAKISDGKELPAPSCWE